MKVLGWILFIVCGLWAFIIELYYAYNILGFLGIVLGIAIFPALLAAMPFYALFAFGNWSPLVLSIISIIGQLIASKSHD